MVFLFALPKPKNNLASQMHYSNGVPFAMPKNGKSQISFATKISCFFEPPTVSFTTSTNQNSTINSQTIVKFIKLQELNKDPSGNSAFQI